MTTKSRPYRFAALGFLCLAIALVRPIPAHSQTWTIQWSDEFNAGAGTPPSPSIWNFVTGGDQPNREIEVYCAPYSDAHPCDSRNPNLYQDGNGHLVIKAINNKGTWTSGRMNSSRKQTFQYGRIEARIKLQLGDGFWPAFWMLGSNGQRWPANGEQDIMEWVQRYGPRNTSSTIHGPGYSGANGIGSQYTFGNGGRIDDGNYHTYGLIWTQNKMQYYRDNPSNPFFTITPSNIPSGTTWMYDQPFYLLLNFAIGGGGFPGYTNSSTPNTGTMLVDYVRVYQPSSTIDSTVWYSVANENSGACIDDKDHSTSDRVIVQQSACAGSSNNQEWQFTPTDSGYYKVKSRQAGLVWDVAGSPGALGSGALIQLSSYGGGGNQQWQPVSNGDGTYRFVARHSGLCIDVPGASASSGVQLQQYSCNGTSAQSFTLSQQP